MKGRVGGEQRRGKGWRARLCDDERRVGHLLLVPSIALVAALAVVPLLVLGWLGFRRYMPVFDVSRFVGLDNYRFLFEDPRFGASLLNTLYITAVSVALELVLGLAIALLLHRALCARGLVRAAVLVPWALPTVVAAWTWEWIFNPGSGILNHLLQSDANWLGDPRLAIHAVILADVWKSTPFAALLLLAGLQMVPTELLRAAEIDGAGPVRRLVSITLPCLRPTILVVALFRTLDAFRIFDVVYVLTGGGPANTTETLSLYAYKLYFQTMQFGYGSAVSMAMFLIMAAISAVYVWLLAGRER